MTSEPLTDEDLPGNRERWQGRQHTEATWIGGQSPTCGLCFNPWPCPWFRLAAAESDLATTESALAETRGALERVLERHQSHPAFSGEKPITGCACGYRFANCPTRAIIVPVLASLPPEPTKEPQ
jgi:hypothetical protein